jgi:hypothetical protein
MRKSVEILIRAPTVKLPISLYTDLRKLLKDPLTNRLRYGDYTRLIIRLLSNWVDEQRATTILTKASQQQQQQQQQPPSIHP